MITYKFLEGMAESYGIYVSSPPSPLQITVIWATRLKNAWESADARPENPYADAEIEYSEDMLLDAVKDWIKSIEYTGN